MTTIVKKQVTATQFEKEVEVEAAYLMHFNNLDKAQADKSALENIAARYEVV